MSAAGTAGSTRLVSVDDRDEIAVVTLDRPKADAFNGEG